MVAFNAEVMLGEGGGEWKGRWDVMEASGGETTSGFWFWWRGKEVKRGWCLFDSFDQGSMFDPGLL